MTTETPRAARRGGRIAGLASAGVLAALVAVGVSNVALAQPAEQADAARAVAAQNSPAQNSPTQSNPTQSNETVWNAFDACLIEQGVDLEGLESAEGAEPVALSGDEAAIEAAFEACESSLEEHEDALWVAFDDCLVEQGLDIEALDEADDKGELSAEDEGALGAAIEVCEPLLGDLEELEGEFEASDEWEFDDTEHEALEIVFDEFEDCIDVAVDDAAIADCERILEDLPAGVIVDADFEGCDDDEDGADEEEDDEDEDGADEDA